MFVTFAKTIYSPNIINDNQGFLQFLNTRVAFCAWQTYSFYHKKPLKLKKLIELKRDKEDKADLNWCASVCDILLNEPLAGRLLYMSCYHKD